MKHHITALLKAHSTLLLRTLAVLFVTLSIAAASPISAILDSAIAQIEQRAVVEKGIAGMILAHRTYTPAQSEEESAMLVKMEFLYRGRASAMEEIAGYLKTLRFGDKDEPIKP